MQHFGIQISQISHHEYEDRLDNAHVIREACHHSSHKSPNNSFAMPHKRQFLLAKMSERFVRIRTYYCSAERDAQKAPCACPQVNELDVLKANFAVILAHVIEDDLLASSAGRAVNREEGNNT